MDGCGHMWREASYTPHSSGSTLMSHSQPRISTATSFDNPEMSSTREEDEAVAVALFLKIDLDETVAK